MTDISALVADIKNHRFNGYSALMIATEIDKVRSGPGPGSINAAVQALRDVATALEDTEQTLNSELGKLGVSWHGGAALDAGATVTEHAEFSAQMSQTLQGSAESLFAQGDAFNRTKGKLPDAELVRKSSGGTTLGDELLSLIGFETDHAQKMADADEAKKHAVQVLNEYAMESGSNLESVEPGADPEMLSYSIGQGGPSVINAGGGPAGQGPGVGGVVPEGPAGSMPMGFSAGAAVPGAPQPSAAPSGVTPSSMGQPGAPSPYTSSPGVPQAGVPASYAPEQSYDPPTPPTGFTIGAVENTSAVQPSGDSGTTSTAGFVPTPAPTPAPGGVPLGGGAGGGLSGLRAGGYDVGTVRVAGGSVPTTGGQSTHGGLASGGSTGRTTGRLLGRMQVAAPGTSAPTGQVPSGGSGRPVGRPLMMLRPGGAPDSSSSLAPGRSSGLTKQDSPSRTYDPAGYSARPRGGASVADVGAGAAAIGAGGAAGMTSGDSERQGRGVGRSAPSAGSTTRQVAFGSGPDADEADAAERTERGTSRGSRQAGGLMQRAAPQDGEEDGEHVRSWGVDDADLFADQRMVAPESIDGADDPDDPASADDNAGDVER